MERVTARPSQFTSYHSHSFFVSRHIFSVLIGIRCHDFHVHLLKALKITPFSFSYSFATSFHFQFLSSHFLFYFRELVSQLYTLSYIHYNFIFSETPDPDSSRPLNLVFRCSNYFPMKCIFNNFSWQNPSPDTVFMVHKMR